MLKKEFTINHSLDEIRNAVTKVVTKNPTKFKKLTFDDSFGLIKLWGEINFGAGVAIEIYYKVVEPSKVDLRIEYVGSGARQDINEANEASFERDFSNLFSKYLKGDDDAEDSVGGGSGCMSTIMLLVATAALLLGVYALIISM